MYNYVYMRLHEILAVDDVPSTPRFLFGGEVCIGLLLKKMCFSRFRRFVQDEWVAKNPADITTSDKLILWFHECLSLYIDVTVTPVPFSFQMKHGRKHLFFG